MGLSELKRIYDGCDEYARYVAAGNWMEDRRHVSPFWEVEFSGEKRVNYPDFNSMLVMRRGATYPMADSAADADPSEDRRAAEAAYAVVSQSVPAAYFESLDESAVGSPRCFDVGGHSLSAGAIVNALTAYRIASWVQRLRFDRRLNVLEIGAGYGQAADQLLRRLPIERYVVCDLPQNLFLSSYYLQANFPDRRARFVRPDAGRDEAPGQLEFLVPPFLPHLGGSFDLIINSYSFQEMTQASVNEYFEFARRCLAPDGLVYSLNAHGKSGVDWPSDYPIEGFTLLGFSPVRRFPHHYVFATNPFEMVLTPAGSPVRRSAESTSRMDALGECFQLGLDDDLSGVASRFVAGSLEPLEAAWLDDAGRLVRCADAAGKRVELETMTTRGTLSHVTAYIAGSVAFATGENQRARPLLERSVGQLARSHARVLSALMLAWLDREAGDAARATRNLDVAIDLLPHLRDELQQWATSADLPAMVAQRLRLKAPTDGTAATKPGRSAPLLTTLARIFTTRTPA